MQLNNASFVTTLSLKFCCSTCWKIRNNVWRSSILHQYNAISDISQLQFCNHIILQHCFIPSTCDGAYLHTTGCDIFVKVRTQKECPCDIMLHRHISVVLGTDATLWGLSSAQWTQFLEFTLSVRVKCASSVHNIRSGHLLSSPYLMRKKFAKSTRCWLSPDSNVWTRWNR